MSRFAPCGLCDPTYVEVSECTESLVSLCNRQAIIEIVLTLVLCIQIYYNRTALKAGASRQKGGSRYIFRLALVFIGSYLIVKLILVSGWSNDFVVGTLVALVVTQKLIPSLMMYLVLHYWNRTAKAVEPTKWVNPAHFRNSLIAWATIYSLVRLIVEPVMVFNDDWRPFRLTFITIIALFDRLIYSVLAVTYHRALKRLVTSSSMSGLVATKMLSAMLHVSLFSLLMVFIGILRAILRSGPATSVQNTNVVFTTTFGGTIFMALILRAVSSKHGGNAVTAMSRTTSRVGGEVAPANSIARSSVFFRSLHYIKSDASLNASPKDTGKGRTPSGSPPVVTPATPVSRAMSTPEVESIINQPTLGASAVLPSLPELPQPKSGPA